MHDHQWQFGVEHHSYVCRFAFLVMNTDNSKSKGPLSCVSISSKEVRTYDNCVRLHLQGNPVFPFRLKWNRLGINQWASGWQIQLKCFLRSFCIIKKQFTVRTILSRGAPVQDYDIRGRYNGNDSRAFRLEGCDRFLWEGTGPIGVQPQSMKRYIPKHGRRAIRQTFTGGQVQRFLVPRSTKNRGPEGF